MRQIWDCQTFGRKTLAYLKASRNIFVVDADKSNLLFSYMNYGCTSSLLLQIYALFTILILGRQ